MIHLPVDSGDQDLMDLAEALGVDVAAEFNSEPEDILNVFAGHPALGFLSTFDDVDQQTSPGVQKYSPSSNVCTRQTWRSWQRAKVARTP